MIKRPHPRLQTTVPDKPDRIKICVVGEPRIGKSQLLNQLCNSKFSDIYEQTIGSDFYLYQGPKLNKGSKNI